MVSSPTPHRLPMTTLAKLERCINVGPKPPKISCRVPFDGLALQLCESFSPSVAPRYARRSAQDHRHVNGHQEAIDDLIRIELRGRHVTRVRSAGMIAPTSHTTSGWSGLRITSTSHGA